MPQFIGREDWLQRFQDYLQQQQGVIWRVTGQPGIGKSTLLRQFESNCEDAEHPVTWLDMEGFAPAHGLEVLTEIVRSARFFNAETAGKTKREKAGEAAVWLKDKLGGVMDAGKLLDPTGGLIVGGAKVLLDLGIGFAGGAAQMSENAAAANPELFLLEALAKAGGMHPVLLVDTYEHILRQDLKVQSRLVLGHGQAHEGSIVKAMGLPEWLRKLLEYLQAKGWRIVMAGREVPQSNKRDDQYNDQLPRFSRDEILQAARIRPALAEYLPVQESAIASVLSTLSFDGNPLWLQVAMNLLENLLMEGKDLAQLAQQPEYLHECFETDDPFDTGAYDGIEYGRCKLTLISTLTRHISDLDDHAWKIALPRVLERGIVMQLFSPQQANAILHNFKLAGVFRVAGQQFTLHEEIRDLLLAYARSKGWLDTDETRALHGTLWDYLNQTHGKDIDSYPPVWMAEACYQRVMSGVGLLDKQVDPKTFWWEFGGATDLSLAGKWQIVNDLPDMTQGEIGQLRENLVEAKQQLYQLLGSDTVDKLHQDLRDAVVASPWELDYWQQRVTNHGLAGDYFVLQEIQENLVEKIQIIDQMLAQYGESAVPCVQEQCAKALFKKCVTLSEKVNAPADAVREYDNLLDRYSDSAVSDVQEQCAKALYNKGLTLGEKLNDSVGAVEEYDNLLRYYGDSAIFGVQEYCARALRNKGVTLGENLNDPEGEVKAYDNLLHLYGDSVIPAVQEQCAMALRNKGVTLGEKLNDPAGEITVYDNLLHRYGDSAVSGVQESCAKALVNKGLTLWEKLDDPAGAVVVYDDLLHRYDNFSVPGVQEACSRARLNKGVILGKLNDLVGAIACYDEMLARYSQSENLDKQVQYQSALANTAEMLLVLGRNADATQRIRQVLVHTDSANQTFAIMHFLLWLAEADTTPDDVLVAIRALSPAVEFAWYFGEIRPLVDKLPEPRKTQAECFIAFFEQHHDISQLETCLANIPEDN